MKVLFARYDESVGNHLFSMHAKFSEKLTFLTKWMITRIGF